MDKLLLLIVSLLLMPTNGVWAKDEKVSLLNAGEAASYAQNVSKRFLPKDTKIVAAHFGDGIPRELKAAAYRLSREGYQVEIQGATPGEVREDLEKDFGESVKAIDQLSYMSEDGWAPEEVAALKTSYSYHLKKIYESSLGVLGEFAGTTGGGVTYWVNIQPSSEDKLSASKNSKIAVVSFLGVSVYSLGQPVFLKMGQDLAGIFHGIGSTAPLSAGGIFHGFYEALTHAGYGMTEILGSMSVAQFAGHITPAVFLGGWVYLNLLYSRSISATSAQGKTLAKTIDPETGRPRWEIKPHPFFMAPALFVRSALTNIVILTGMHIFENPLFLLQGETWGAILVNSAAAVATKYAFESWITERQARVTRDGTVIPSKDKHTPEQTTRIRGKFEFYKGILSSLNIVGVPGLKHVFPAFGAATLLYLVWKNRETYRHNIVDLPMRFRKLNLAACSTYFMMLPR